MATQVGVKNLTYRVLNSNTGVAVSQSTLTVYALALVVSWHKLILSSEGEITFLVQLMAQ